MSFSSCRILSSMSEKRATLRTGGNQVGSAPSNGAAASTRKAIPGAPDPAKAHGYCFGFGADGEGLAEKLKRVFPDEDGDGSSTPEGCTIRTQVRRGGSDEGQKLWKLDQEGHLILPAHDTNATKGHPRCQIGGTVPVEKVNGSWHLITWAIPLVAKGEVMSSITHNECLNGAGKKLRDKKKMRK
ncbi:unnamed protein product [Pylaiella littoralis]